MLLGDETDTTNIELFIDLILQVSVVSVYLVFFGILQKFNFSKR